MSAHRRKDELSQLGAYALGREGGLSPTPRGNPALTGRLRIVEELEQPVREPFWIVAWHHDPGRVVTDDLPNAGSLGGDGREAAGHRLHERDGEALQPRRECVCIGRDQEITELRPIVDEAANAVNAADVRRGQEPIELVSVVASADQEEAKVLAGPRAADRAPRLDQDVEAFLGHRNAAVPRDDARLGREIESPPCVLPAAGPPDVRVDWIEDSRHSALIETIEPSNAFGLAGSRDDQPLGRPDGEAPGQPLEPAPLVVAPLEAREDRQSGQPADGGADVEPRVFVLLAQDRVAAKPA